MIPKPPHRQTLGGVALLLSGLLLAICPIIYSQFEPNTNAALLYVAYLLPVVTVQLLQGGTRPILGLIATTLLLVLFLSVLLPTASSGAFDPFAYFSAWTLVFLSFIALFYISPYASVFLLGISMTRAKYFPSRWGYAVAAVALASAASIAVVGRQWSLIPLAVAFFILGLREVPAGLFRRGSLLVAVAAVVAALLLRLLQLREYKVTRENWTTYFPTDRTVCDLSGARIDQDGQRRVWITGWGECDFFESAHVFDGVTWSALQIDARYSDVLDLDANGRLRRLRQTRSGSGPVSSLEVATFVDGEWLPFVSVATDALDQRYASGGLATDRNGNIWIPFARLPAPEEPASWTTGLSVFDGQEWTTYTSDSTPALASGRMYGPQFDNNNRAWFWSEEGTLAIFDGQRWSTYPQQHLNLPQQDRVIRVGMDLDGKPWLATSSGLIISADGSRRIAWRQAAEPDYSPYLSSAYFHFAFDLEGRLWVASLVEGAAQLSVFNRGSWTIFTHENSGLASEPITDMTIDAAGRVWLVTPSGIRVFSPH